MGSKRKAGDDEDNGFAAWGGYMAAKKAKLLDQFQSSTSKQSDIFRGVAIYVNGYTTPSVDELKVIMATHGGVYHHYQDSGPTTHIIASNLPNVKIKNMGTIPIVKPEWITDSLTAGSLQDYRKYLLYSNQSRTQPTLKATLTAADPKFLSEFYNNSRLHLISTLGAEFKQLVTQLRERSDGRFPGKERLLNLGSNKSLSSSDSVVMHIDMDCFFVSVGLRNRPELKEKPVAVTHAKRNQAPSGRAESVQKEVALLKEKFPEGSSHFDSVDSSGSFSEIASCSYEARERGVRNGMLLGAAVKLCPDLRTIPYDFDGYREVSKTLYHTIASYTLDIEAVSCDEMYVDVSNLLRDTGTSVEQWASHIRSEIMQATGCPCSTGFGANRLQARLATRKAKPAGQHYLKPEDVGWFMSEIPLAHLPGVGHATVTKLEAMGYKTCGELENASVQRLQAEFGAKTGAILLEQVRGIDRKPLNFNHERKSVSADVNYGIRFKSNEEALNFLLTLSQEVYQRLSDIGMRARGLTLKLLIRAPDAPVETAKFLGCGVCNAINRSTTSNGLIADAATVFNEAKVLFEKVKAVPQDLRGVGIQLTKLEKMPPVNTVLSKFLQQGGGGSGSKAKVAENKAVTRATGGGKKGKKSKKKVAANSLVNYFKAAPDRSGQACPREDIDLAILDELPEDIRKEVIKQYHLDATKPPAPQEQQQQQQQIEQSVLDELPEDIRDEVMREYNITAPPSTSTAKQPEIDEAVPSTSAAATSVDDRLEPDKAERRIEHFRDLTWDELKEMFLVWLKVERKPKPVDVSMLAEYFKQMAIDRNIEQLEVLLRFLHRHISKLDTCDWHEAYCEIVNTAQEGMVARYGATLAVSKKFACSFHNG